MSSLSQQIEQVANLLSLDPTISDHISIAWILHEDLPVVKLFYDNEDAHTKGVDLLKNLPYIVLWEQLNWREQTLQPFITTLDVPTKD